MWKKGNGPFNGGDGVGEKKRTEAPSSFSSATAGSVSLFSTFFSLMVKKEGKEVIEDSRSLCSKKKEYT
jgi:hypothetical protein